MINVIRGTKYNIRKFREDFPLEETCLRFIFGIQTKSACPCGGLYRALFWTDNAKFKGRKQFQCSRCRKQLSPLANTIFHKSSTPLILWFQALFILSQAKRDISAKELERQLGVTYKCAYRILAQIRKTFRQNNNVPSVKSSSNNEKERFYSHIRASAFILKRN